VFPFAGCGTWSPLEDSQISGFPRMTVVQVSACPTSHEVSVKTGSLFQGVGSRKAFLKIS